MKIELRSRMRRGAVLAAAVLLSGCVVGQDYTRPKVEIPTTFRGLSADQSTGTTEGLGDQKWAQVFQDEQLQRLIQTALEQNYDLRIAAARILEAEAQVGITRADQLPTVEAGAQAGRQRVAASRFSAFSFNTIGLNASASWQPDFWGKFKRANEAARADLLATEAARRAVMSTLVADVASSYFLLRELDLELAISRNTLASRRESLQLTQDLADRGLASLLDVRQAEQLVYTASARIPDLEQRIEQQENFISTLMGAEPGAVIRGRELSEQPHLPEVPAGLPSALLDRRPDILQAEQQLVAANARVAQVKANFFPQILLTGMGGVQSTALRSLFAGPAGTWSAFAQATETVFSGGRRKSEQQLAEARRQEALLFYQQTIQRAFQDVSDALIAYQKTQEVRRQQESLVRAAEEAARLADVRYRGGVSSYLEVLTNQTNQFSAELGLAQARAAELQALVQLYRALGGGWQP